MASNLKVLSQKFGCFARNYTLYQNSLKITQNSRFTTTAISSLSVGSENAELTHKKKLKRSSNFKRVGENVSVSDENPKVNTLKASELPGIRRTSPNNTKEGIKPSSIAPNAKPTEAPNAKPTEPFVFHYVLDEQNTVNSNFLETAEEAALFDSKILQSIKDKDAKGESLSTLDRRILLVEELRTETRTKSFNESLAAYISVCMHSGLTEEAYQTLQHFAELQNDGKRFRRALSIMPYNEMLKGLAYQGDYKTFKNVLERLKKSSLTPTLDTFAHILTILGREANTESNVSEVRSTLLWMEEQGIGLNELFEKAPFVGDSLKFCIKSVERINPNIKSEINVLNPMSENLQERQGYNNRLLNKLNDSMFTNKVSSPVEGVFKPEELKPLIDKQIEQELHGSLLIPTIYTDIPDDLSKNRDLIERWKVDWRKSLKESVPIYKKILKENFNLRQTHDFDIYPFFCVLDDDEIVDLLMAEACKLSMLETFPYYLAKKSEDLGEEFFLRFQIKSLETKNYLDTLRKVYIQYCDWYLQRSDEDLSYIPRIEWSNKILGERMDSNLKEVPCEWPLPVKTAVGKLLYNIIVASLRVWDHNESPENAVAAFNKFERNYGVNTKEKMGVARIMISVCGAGSHGVLPFSTRTVPMISPPIPWTDYDNGGYFAYKSPFVRLLHPAHQQKEMMKSREVQDLHPAMDALNAQASVPWKINKPMLDILIEVFNKNRGEEIEAAPNRPQAPERLEWSSEVSREDIVENRFQRARHTKKLKKTNAVWCEALSKLSVANFYRDRIFWVPRNMDFRGRAYPIPLHLSHHDPGIHRSLFLFAQGKKLGEGGLYWLKLHLINLSGLKKRCRMEEKIEFYDEIKDEIFDSAKHPLTGNKWWMDTDDPWMTLAACKELVGALESENPEEYVSHLPIHQDGSCNGLQHYAALGRDESGAEAVNLKATEFPQDIYSRIAEHIRIQLQEEAKNGDDVAQSLAGVVERNAVKQAVMRVIYGGKRYGAKFQFTRHLNSLSDFPGEKVDEAATYLTTKAFDCLDSNFPVANVIQNWLAKIAGGVAEGCIKNMEWISPMGFPIIQHHGDDNNGPVPTVMVNDEHFLLTDVKKQKTSFAPNFIHTLEASHMMLTTIFCQRAGLSLVSLHDCFWTHASLVPTMNKICREQFVQLHSEPILEDLAKYTAEKFSNETGYDALITRQYYGTDEVVSWTLEEILKEVPPKGSFDLNEVRWSAYFFS